MAFLNAQQLEALTIERMIFHVVGPEDDELILLEEVDLGESSDFFIQRIKSTNNGIMFDFLERSSVLASLRTIEGDKSLFSAESKQLARLFKSQHGGTTSKGVFLMFLMSSHADRFYGVVKYDHQEVVSYSIEDRADRHYALLKELQDTFVKSPEALQKSAMIRLRDDGGELCVKDRVAPKEITQYFRNFLGAQRRHTPSDLTDKLAQITLKVAKDHSSELSSETKKALRHRLYEVVQTHEGFDPNSPEPFLASVFGPLADDSRLRRSFTSGLPGLLCTSD